jgi:hypothetical protein
LLFFVEDLGVEGSTSFVDLEQEYMKNVPKSIVINAKIEKIFVFFIVLEKNLRVSENFCKITCFSKNNRYF